MFIHDLILWALGKYLSFMQMLSLSGEGLKWFWRDDWILSNKQDSACWHTGTFLICSDVEVSGHAIIKSNKTHWITWKSVKAEIHTNMSESNFWQYYLWLSYLGRWGLRKANVSHFVNFWKHQHEISAHRFHADSAFKIWIGWRKEKNLKPKQSFLHFDEGHNAFKIFQQIEQKINTFTG